jgi:hypothetical protein
LKPFTEAGTKASHKMWKNASPAFKEAFLLKKYGDRCRTNKEFVCDFCGSLTIKKVYENETFNLKHHFCNMNCFNEYKKLNIFGGSPQYNTKNIFKINKVRSNFEIEFLMILENFIIKNNITNYKIKYESLIIKYFDLYDDKTHNFHVDFVLNLNDKIFVIEIGAIILKNLKPISWNCKKIAANKYCSENNFKFLFLSDENLKLGIKKNEVNLEYKTNLLKELLNV